MATRQSLVARSSSVVEDMATSSMAGQFESIIGISGFEAFVDAVTAVLDSRQRAGAAEHPIAVLVQPLIEPAYGGVMFGIDPVTGRTDRRVVSAVRGGPEPLVSGEVDGSRYVLDPSNAKVLDFAANDGPPLEGGRPAAARRAVGQGRLRLRRAAGRRVGHRHGQAAVAVAVAPGHHRDPRGSPRTDLRPWSRRRDLPVTRSPSSSTISGFPRSVKRCAKRWCWRARRPRRTWPPATSSCASTGTSPSTCAWPGRSSPS